MLCLPQYEEEWHVVSLGSGEWIYILTYMCRRRELRFPKAGWQVDAAVLKLHSRRVTCLEFHPTRDNLVLSGDKHGQVRKCTRQSYARHLSIKALSARRLQVVIMCDEGVQ